MGLMGANAGLATDTAGVTLITRKLEGCSISTTTMTARLGRFPTQCGRKLDGLGKVSESGSRSNLIRWKKLFRSQLSPERAGFRTFR